MKELDWKILIVLYEKRSISKTAEALYLTQSARHKKAQKHRDRMGYQCHPSQQSGGYVYGRRHIPYPESQHHDGFPPGNTGALCPEGMPEGRADRRHPQFFFQTSFPGGAQHNIERFDRLDIRLIPSSSEVVLQKLMDGSVGHRLRLR